MASRPRSRMATSPPRPAKRWPLVLLILAVASAVAATVLLANERRNLRTLMRFLGVAIPAPAAITPPAAARDEEKPRLPEAVIGWPWRGLATTPGVIEPDSTPADMCSGQAAGTQEIPAFAESEQRGWECSMLRDQIGTNRSASLFLQARGALHEPAGNIRVKFNLADGKLDGDLAAQALAFLRLAASMPRDPALYDILAKMLTTQTDFYFFAGYQGLTFRQEIGDPSRYNLIGTDRTYKTLTNHPKIWHTELPIDEPAQAARTGRLPRLLTLPAGND